MTTTLKPSIRNTLAAFAVGAATLASAATYAQAAPQPATAPAAPVATQAAPAAILTVRQIYDTLTAAGYRNITEIELEHHRGYDVKADDPQGQRVKLRVDAQTGAILRSRIKD